MPRIEPSHAQSLAFTPGAVAATGRVALITGGARQLGPTVVRALASRGYAVAIHCHRSLSEARALAAEVQAAGIPALAVTANMREEGPVCTMVQRVADHFGRIDVLVSAAIISRPVPFEDVTGDDLRAHFDVNCVGAFICAQQVGTMMVRQETGGAIVMLAGSGGHPRPDDALAAPSLTAIPALTRSLAFELARRHPRVRVNALLPGSVGQSGDLAPSGREALTSAVLVHRVGTAEHVAHAVLFLVENDFMTGACLPVDGGRASFG